MLRLITLISLAIAALATLAWSASHIWPTRATLVGAQPDRAVFFASRYGVLSVWTQEITPPAPPGCTPRLTTPNQMSVTVVDPGGRGRSAFLTNFTPDWPGRGLGWEAVQHRN